MSQDSAHQTHDDEFAQARELFSNGTTRAENAEARQQFEALLQVNAGHASAKAYVAHSHIRDWRHNWWADSEQDSLDQAEAAAIAAAGLDDNNADAHASRAIVHLVKGEFADAQKEYDLAGSKSGSPADPDIPAETGFAYIYMDRKADGIALMEQARAAKPAHPWWYESILAWGLYQDKQYSAAVAVIESLDPIVNDVRMILAACQARLGQTQQAQETMALFLQNETWTITDEMGAAFASAEDEAHWMDGLRMAGMPEGSGKTPQP